MKRIGTDFQGWPVCAMTLREMLLKLGFIEQEPGHFHILNTELLDSYPVTLEDDGMGYGVNDRYITEADNMMYEDEVLKEKAFNLFREKYGI